MRTLEEAQQKTGKLTKVVTNTHTNYHRQMPMPAVVLNQGSAEKTQGETREKGLMQKQVVLK
jgi:hypothetical protein